jgi:NADH:ubiquinone oxidoreductase subunit 2 (subunit N)
MSDVSQGEGWWQASDGRWYPPQPATGAPPGPPPMGAPARTSGLAVASLVLGILSLVTCALTGIPGLITGFMAKQRIRESNGTEQGDGLATGGIVTSVVGLVLAVGFVVLILAVTLLGKSASSKFSSVGSAVAGRVVVDHH